MFGKFLAGVVGLDVEGRIWNENVQLTDIRMPLMDGLELVRQIRKLEPEVEVIYITGFSDVSYLRDAVKNAAVDYILKPVEPQEFLAAIQKCVDRVRQRCQSEEYLSVMERYARLGGPMLRKQLLSRVLYGDYPSREAVLERAEFLELPIDVEVSYQAAVLSFCRDGSMSGPLDDMTDEILSVGISNIAEEIISSGLGNGHIVGLGGLDFVCILPGGDPDRCLQTLNAIRIQTLRYLKVEVFAVMGPVVEGFFAIQESFNLACAGLQQQFRFAPGTIASYEDCGPDVDGGYSLDSRQLEDLCAKAYTGDVEGTRDLWREIWRGVSDGLGTARDISGLCVLVCGHVFLNGGRRSVSSEESAMFREFLTRLGAARYSQDFSELAESFLQELAMTISSRRVPRRQQIVEDIKAYIMEELETGLTIRDISARIFLAPTYLCTLFKEETGETINAYMTRQRMAHAAKLLSTGEYKIYELAKRLGYTDVKYFSSLFKRYLGQPPSKYLEDISDDKG